MSHTHEGVQFRDELICRVAGGAVQGLVMAIVVAWIVLAGFWLGVIP